MIEGISVPEGFSIIGLYGDKGVFEKRLKEGCTDVAFGSGDWIDDVQRIVAIFAFYKPEGIVSTLEHPKYMTSNLNTMRGEPFESLYNEDEFKEYGERFRIKMGEKVKLAEIIEKWD